MNPTTADPGWLRLRDEAFLLLEGRGAILDAAREISRALNDAGIDAPVIGGIAVVLHGHRRTTVDIDFFVAGPLEPVVDVLAGLRFKLDEARREFVRDGLPVHLVTPSQVGTAPGRCVEIEGITTVSLADLIAMKLRSGGANLLRAQDLADVIGLARHLKPSEAFVAKLPRDVRPAFREIIRALDGEARRRVDPRALAD